MSKVPQSCACDASHGRAQPAIVAQASINIGKCRGCHNHALAGAAHGRVVDADLAAIKRFWMAAWGRASRGLRRILPPPYWFLT